MNLLSDAEYLTIMDIISTFSVGGLEAFYDEQLKRDILRRATPEQRKRLYDRFMMFYRVKSKEIGRKMRSDITDVSNWMNADKPYYVSKFEEKAVMHYINGAETIEKLDEYYKWVVNHIFPRATLEQRKRIMGMYDRKLLSIENKRKAEQATREAMEAVQKTPRPERGQEVSMDGNKGVVIDRSVTAPEVEVRWSDGSTSWIHPRYLKW